MNSPKIEKILERYFQGESSLQEEQTLREFFSQDKLPAHLAELKDQFMMFGDEAGRELPGSFDDRLFEMISEKERDTRMSRRRVTFPAVLSHGAGAFLDQYLRRGGFRDGARGFLNAWVHAFTKLSLYAKVWDAGRRGRQALVDPYAGRGGSGREPGEGDGP